MSCEHEAWWEIFRRRLADDWDKNFSFAAFGTQISAGFSALGAAAKLIPGLGQVIDNAVQGASSAGSSLGSTAAQGVTAANAAGAAASLATEVALGRALASFPAVARAAIDSAMSAATSAYEAAVSQLALARAAVVNAAEAVASAIEASTQAAARNVIVRAAETAARATAAADATAAASAARSAVTTAEILEAQRLTAIAELSLQAIAPAEAATAAALAEVAAAEAAIVTAEVAAAAVAEAEIAAVASVGAADAALVAITAAAAEALVVLVAVTEAVIVAAAIWAAGTAIGTIVQASVEATDEYLAQFKECGELPDWLRDLIAGGNFIGDPLGLAGLLVRAVVGDEELKRLLPNLLVPAIPIPAHWLPDIFGPLFVRRDPLVLDLNGGGVALTSLTGSTVQFDLNGDGFAERTGWVRPGDGLLALDSNGNGIIDNGNELFGTSTQDGFTVLRTYDANNDNVIDGRDAVYANLLVWRDANLDGVSQVGELWAANDNNKENLLEAV
jgi:hypothetical protein